MSEVEGLRMLARTMQCVGHSGQAGSAGRCSAPVKYRVEGRPACGWHMGWLVARLLDDGVAKVTVTHESPAG